jgi:aminoglycoside phosphotransferase (APT) family kinase protein
VSGAEPSELAGALRGVVADALGDGSLHIDGLRRLTGGASRETWSFTAVTGEGERRPLILRRDLGGEPATGRGFSTEVAALGAARDAGVPEPRVLATSDDPSALGAPFVLMDHVEGETLAPRILRDEALAGVRPRLAEQCGQILARIHSIPVERVPGLEQPDPVESLRRDLAEFDEPSPAFELGLRRLEATRPPAAEPVLVHGDFRNGNLIVGQDGIRAVLDWELVQVGDPMQDLGHLCARVWRFGGPGPVGGFGEYEDLFRGYERAGGRRIDPAVLRWWELRATLWWGIGCMQMAWRHLSGATRSVELAAIGRRAWEQEYDVMLLLADERDAG